MVFGVLKGLHEATPLRVNFVGEEVIFLILCPIYPEVNIIGIALY